MGFKENEKLPFASKMEINGDFRGNHEQIACLYFVNCGEFIKIGKLFLRFISEKGILNMERELSFTNQNPFIRNKLEEIV